MDDIEEEVNGFKNVLPPGLGAEETRNDLMENCCKLLLRGCRYVPKFPA